MAIVQTMELEETTDTWPSRLLSTPKEIPVKSEDDATMTGVSVSTDSEGLSTTESLGLCWRETYCLLVLVTCNVDSVSALDLMVPAHVWTKLIAWDICTYRLWVPASMFSVELLSDTEFLLFQGPHSGRGMTWEKTLEYIQNLHGVTNWGGTEVTMVSGQCTMKQSKIDLAHTPEYYWAHTLEWMATAEGWLRALAVDKTKSPSPTLRGRGYIWWADQYFVQKFARSPALEPTLHTMKPTSLQDFHSTWEPLELYESDQMEDVDSDSTGYSKMSSWHDTNHSQCSNTKN